jgi:hypothetical protein
MKKLITLLFSAGLVTAVFAQSGGHRNDSRSYDNSYQSSPYSNNDQYTYQDQYSNEDRYNRNPGYHNRYESKRQRLARQRYEMMMMRRNQARYHNQRSYDIYSPYISPRPSLQIRIGIGGRSRY